MAFVAIDFETANSDRASACALGVAVVIDGQIIETRSWLVRPRNMAFDGINMMIHGITPEMVEHEPEFDELWPVIEPYLVGRTVIAHNAGFDLSVLRHTFDFYGIQYPELDYFCTRVLAKVVWPGWLSYGLDVVAEELGIVFNHHDAADDARACAEIALHGCQHLGVASLQDALTAISMNCGRLTRSGCVSWQSTLPQRRPKDIMPQTTEFDVDHPFYNRMVVFTGTLQSMRREDAMQHVVNVGGVCGDNVTKKIHYLVVGDQDFFKLKGGTKSSKMKRAEDLIGAGVNLEVVPETEFLRLLST